MLTFLIVLGCALMSTLAILAVMQHRTVTRLRDLCELRQNTIDLYRRQLKDHVATHLRLTTEVDGIIQEHQKFLLRFRALQNALVRAKQEALGARQINEELVLEFSKVLQQRHSHQEDLDKLKGEKFELRQQLIHSELLNRKLAERNEELEYAINLESISMLEAYQEQGKLFSAISDVRRSLTRILNTA